MRRRQHSKMEWIDKAIIGLIIYFFVFIQVVFAFGIDDIFDLVFLVCVDVMMIVVAWPIVGYMRWKAEFDAECRKDNRRWRQDLKIEAGEPTLRGVVKEFRVEGSNVTYSGTMVVGGRKVEFMDLGPPTIKIGCEYKIWMNGKRLLKYREVSEWGEDEVC